MDKRYSIADARSKLPGILNEVESGDDVELTRHGRSVAVLVSVRKYRRLVGGQQAFSEAYEGFLERFPLQEVGIEEGFFNSLRDQDEGRKVGL